MNSLCEVRYYVEFHNLNRDTRNYVTEIFTKYGGYVSEK